MVAVPQVACPRPTRRLRLPKHLLGAMADVLGMGALHIGAAARHADGTRLHAGVRGVPACRRATSPDAHAVRLLGNQGRSPRRHGGGDQRHPHPLCPRRPVCGGGARRRRAQGHERSKRCEPPRCPQAPRLTPHPRSERAGAWSRPCKCTRDLAVRARRSTLVTRSAAATRSTVPARQHGSTAELTSSSSHGDSGAQEHRRLRSSRWRGVATLRRDGQIPNMVQRRRVSTSWHHRKDQGGEKRGERPR
jgi:hypothetical protein